MKIMDNNGVWLINTSQYRMFDHEQNFAFEPGEPTKALVSAFVKQQVVIKYAIDPTLAEDEQADAQAKADALNAAADDERNGVNTAADAVMAEDNEALVEEAKAIAKPKKK